jgi:hypothetical protein
MHGKSMKGTKAKRFFLWKLGSHERITLMDIRNMLGVEAGMECHYASGSLLGARHNCDAVNKAISPALRNWYIFECFKQFCEIFNTTCSLYAE